MIANNQTFTTLPLSTLRVDAKANVRVIGRGNVDPIIKASILAHGLLQPLRVRPNGTGHIVIDGGMRLAALQALAKDGALPVDYATPVIVDDAMNDGEARETSLALNVARVAMHPVDEYRAYLALNTDKTYPLDVKALSERFGKSEKGIRQRLALGELDDKVLDAWRDGTINESTATAFTLADKKAQRTALASLMKEGNFNRYMVQRALKLNDNNHGRHLSIIGLEAYQARGGRVTEDLFGNDHQVSDPVLVKTMLDEHLEATAERLRADGWSWAMVGEPEQDWTYGHMQPNQKPTAEESKRLKELEAICQDDDEDQDVVDAASEEADRINDAIFARGFSEKQKATGGCIVSLTHHGKLDIDYGRTKPKEQKASAKSTSSATGKDTKAKAKPADEVSQKLTERLSVTLTDAAGLTLDKQVNVALAALLAGIASGDQTVTASARGGRDLRKSPSFETIFASSLKMTTAEQTKALAAIAAKATYFVHAFGRQEPLKNNATAALCNAIDAKAFNKAIREKFDAKDFFASVSRSQIVAAVAEAISKDQADKVAKMGKADAVKFAVANLPKTGWLPTQLRTKHYDGPVKKAAKPVAKKAVAKKKAR